MEEFENGMMRFRTPGRHEGKVHYIHPNPYNGPKALCRPAFLKTRSIAVGVPDGSKVTCRLCLKIQEAAKS